MKATRKILILLTGLGLLVTGITIPNPCQAQTPYYPTPQVNDYDSSSLLPNLLYSLLNQTAAAPQDYYAQDYYAMSPELPQDYYDMSAEPQPWKHGYKKKWKEYRHGKHKHKIKHKHRRDYEYYE